MSKYILIVLLQELNQQEMNITASDISKITVNAFKNICTPDQNTCFYSC
jgi:hypothetical protein